MSNADVKHELEKFFVKHYSEDERPTIKGNGFDGLVIGDDREEAQDFVDFINKIIDSLNPRTWTDEQSQNWHKSLPDVYKAFEALREQIKR